ncbi:imidazoleglycerol-phosphate dehydratase HisB [bacterium]|nr:imidazoleglycerol-phosphate dehydratase HisB [bacterium]
MRKAKIDRRTKETQIRLELNLDGKGSYEINTPIPFMSHMLELLEKFGFIDLKIKASGDIRIDDHHTTEDLGICLGQAIKKALGKKKGIFRYGFSLVPMDEALSEISLDLSNRPYLVFNIKFRKEAGKRREFNFELIEDFFRALCVNAGITVHVNLKYGRNNHHIAESIFKGFGLALRQAVMIDPQSKRSPSTKGRL